MQNIFIDVLPPWVETGLQPAFYDLESGTVLQQTARMYAKVRELTEGFNTFTENVTNEVNSFERSVNETVAYYIEKFTELHDYVHDYFDNLDVQEEINHKLDEMVESGEFSELIAEYIGLGALVTYNTLDDLISSENVSNGCKVKTLGKYTKGDGFGAIYTIGETGDIELQNGLYATLVSNFGGHNYIDEITVQQIRRYDTDCYIITIPKETAKGEAIQPHIEKDDTKTPLEHADATFSTLTTNASLWIKAPEGSGITSAIPSMIGDGVILKENNDFVGSSLADNYMYLGIKENRDIVEYKVNETTAQDMIDDGCVQAFDVYYKLVENGFATDLSNVVTNESGVVTKANPRQCLGVKIDGTWIILTCDGRTGNDSGLTSAQTQSVLLEFGCVNAWNLDGGGSTSSTYKGSKINRNIDNNRTTERVIPYTLNFRAEIIDEELAKAYSTIGIEKQNALEQVYESVVQNKATDITGQDLNDLTDSVIFAYGNGMLNRPSVRNGYFVNIPHSWAEYRNKFAKQFYYERDSFLSYERELINGTFTNWRRIGLNRCFCRAGAYTIATTNTYEKVPISSATPISNSNIVTLNDDNTFSFGTGGYGYATLTICVQTDSASVAAGDKYISLQQNGVQQTGYVMKWHNNANTATMVTTTWSFVINSSSDKYAVLLYGTQGDKFQKVNVQIDVC